MPRVSERRRELGPLETVDAAQLRAAAAAGGVSERALARESGVSKTLVHALLTGQSKRTRRHTIDALARALGVERSQLLAPPQPKSRRTQGGPGRPLRSVREAKQDLHRLFVRLGLSDDFGFAGLLPELDAWRFLLCTAPERYAAAASDFEDAPRYASESDRRHFATAIRVALERLLADRPDGELGLSPRAAQLVSLLRALWEAMATAGRIEHLEAAQRTAAELPEDMRSPDRTEAAFAAALHEERARVRTQADDVRRHCDALLGALQAMGAPHVSR